LKAACEYWTRTSVEVASSFASGSLFSVGDVELPAKDFELVDGWWTVSEVKRRRQTTRRG
jgi:hypothetical protein